ncbi:hypothetical protein SLA2020_483680 [Shorea laevis]
MSWADMGSESTWQAAARAARSPYIPPHLRHQNANVDASSYGFSSESTPAPFHRSNSARPAGNGRGRGRGRGRGQSSNRQNLRSNPNPYPDSDDLSHLTDKFDELEVIEDTSAEVLAANLDAYEDIPVETSGDDIPPPVKSFSDIDLGDGLKQNIKRCKYLKPTPVQRHAIPMALAGRDLMACAQTGSGKTAAFCFPIICGVLKDRVLPARGDRGRGGRMMACPLALILAPTRELSCQIHEEAKKFAYQTGAKIVVAYGGAPIAHQLHNLERGVDILVATPGRLVDMIERGRVSLRMIKYLALDEADRMLDMGFEPQIRKIVEQMDMPPPGRRQTMLFSATFPNEIQRLASDFLSNYIFLSVGRVGSSTDLIIQRVELVQEMDKRNYLLDLLCALKHNETYGKHALTLIFVETKRGADALEDWLSRNGFLAIAIHGDKGQMERERALRSFKTGVTPILVATDVASRGLDIPHVSHVINFDLPKDIDDYVHRIGRTGRAGKSGLATAFFSDKNLPLAKALVELMKESNQEIPSWLNEYAENSSYSGGGGRVKRYGGKFGGHDFRKGAQSGSGKGYYSSTYGDTGPVSDAYAASGAVPYAVYGNSDYYAPTDSNSYTNADYVADGNAMPDAAASSHGYGYGYGSVVPSGWD